MCIFYIAILCMCVIWTLDGHWKSFVLDEKDRSRYFPFSVFCHPSSVIYWGSGPQVHFIQRFFYVSSTSLQLSLGKNSHNLTPKICEQLFIFSSGSGSERSLEKFWRNQKKRAIFLKRRCLV